MERSEIKALYVEILERQPTSDDMIAIINLEDADTSEVDIRKLFEGQKESEAKLAEMLENQTDETEDTTSTIANQVHSGVLQSPPQETRESYPVKTQPGSIVPSSPPAQQVHIKQEPSDPLPSATKILPFKPKPASPPDSPSPTKTPPADTKSAEKDKPANTASATKKVITKTELENMKMPMLRKILARLGVKTYYRTRKDIITAILKAGKGK